VIAGPASRPFLLVNPRSGDESPTAAELRDAAERLGVDARELSPQDDAAALAREAVAAGASVLGMAGGDGSLACVAEVAIERDVPFVAIPFGTRNHFARDLGLDRDDPLGSLAAFDGEERRVDIGLVNGSAFVNNVSLGVYASFVHDPARKTRNRLMAFLRMVPAGLGRSRRPLGLSFDVDGRRQEHLALVVLVANNDYRMTSMADLGERSRLDEGVLHAYVVEAVGRGALVAMLAQAVAGRAEEAEGWVEWASAAFRVETRRRTVNAAVDGEPVVLEPPLEFEVRPRALRVLVPRP
jgi:diacylglycerol kinase family enzyme